MPTDMPAIVASARGVSCTRSLPKRSCRPAVARNTPPLAPTSCPITITSESCCISQPCAIAMASTMVIFANSMTAGFCAVLARRRPLMENMRRRRGEQMVEHCIGRLFCFREVGVDGEFNLIRALLQQGAFLVRIPESRADHVFTHADHGLETPGLLDLGLAAITACIVGGRMIAQMIGQCLQHARALAAARGLE